MDVAGQVRSGVRWLGLSKGVVQLYTWALTLMTMRILPPTAYGLIAICSIFLTFLALFEELGVRVRLVQMRELTDDYVRSVYGLSILTNCALALTLAAASPLIAALFNEPEIAAVLAVLALQFMISSWGVIPSAMIVRQLNFRAMAVVDVSQAIVAATLTFIFAMFGFGVWSLVFGTIAGTFAKSLAQIVSAPARIKPSFRFQGLGSTLRFGGVVTLQRILWWIYVNLDRFIVGRFFSPHLLGIYAGAMQIASMPLAKAGAALNVVSFSGLSRLAGDMPAFRHYLLKGCHAVALLMFPLFFGIAVIAQELVPVVLGPRWSGMEGVMQILSLSMPARCISLPLTSSLTSLGKPGESLRCTAVATVSFALGICVGSLFGLEGIACGVVVAALVEFGNAAVVVNRVVGVAPTAILRTLYKPLRASLVMAVLVLVLRVSVPWALPSAAGLCFSITVGGAIYLSMCALFDREGFDMILSLLLPKRR